MRRHVYYYTHIELPYEVAADRLGGDPSSWLPAPCLPDDEHWLVELNANGALPDAVANDVAKVEVGPVTTMAGAVLRPVTWRSTGVDRWVPTLSGDLELVKLSDTTCQLSLLGSYRPPLSVIGEIGDRVIGHRVAEAAVRRFVHDLGERLAGVTLRA
jgi:hypothetical protein